MLSGQLAPSSANFQYFLEDDPTVKDELYQTEKNRVPITLSEVTPSATGNATTILPLATTQSATTISFAGLLHTTLPGGSGSPAASSSASLSITDLPGKVEATASTTAALATNSAAEASGRSAALERAYVHDVYENCEEPVGPIRPRVAQFLAGLDPGSIVCDVGCGNGRYLTACNPLICTIGVDRCYRLTQVAREKRCEVALCDNLELPFRDESFDAVLSLAVVHHFATTERRVGAIRELARILRIGGRVIISVWALEQRHRRFESQDVLIPWQPPKNRNYNYSDEEDDDEYLPPYHAYTEDSTNSSRSAGDGDSSSLSSSSPGESCYSFVRRAIQKLAGGRKHPWFLDSWNSKDTKNNSSLEYEDAKDLPIELRRLEDFEDFPDPPLSAGLKSRSLGSILNPPPRQIVRSRSSVPSLGAQIPEPKPPPLCSGASLSSGSASIQQQATYVMSASSMHNSTTSISAVFVHQDSALSDRSSPLHSAASITSLSGRRPKLTKQKQSLCDDDYQLPDTVDSSSSGNLSSSLDNPKILGSSGSYQKNDSKLLLRKQSSLNEELMAENRLREKDRVRKRIQKQMSLNEAFLCRSVFTKRLQVIREGFTTKLKTSTGSLERVTKNGLVKIIQNIKNSTKDHSHDHNHHHNSHHHQGNNTNHHGRSNSITSTTCAESCGASNSTPAASLTNNCSTSSNCNTNNIIGSEDQKPRRHSRESGSDSSKDSSLQSDTSIESEDSFASVIFIPRTELSNQQQQKCSQNSNSCTNDTNSINNSVNCKNNSNSQKIPSVPTSPLIMPCPPTPAHSPAAATSSTSIPASSSSTLSSTITTSSAILTNATALSVNVTQKLPLSNNILQGSAKTTSATTNRFTFDADHIQQQHQQLLPTNSEMASIKSRPKLPKITRQIVKDLPQIPKFRKQQSLQQQPNKSAFPIVRRSSAAPSVPKLMSLEIYNPETDDLDSDSSEPSSPDSIDSVISALKPGPVDEEPEQEITQPQLHQQELQKHQQEQLQLQELIQKSNDAEVTSLSKIDDVVGDQLSNILNIKDTLLNNTTTSTSDDFCHQHLVDFAEKLSAQLLKELDDSDKLNNFDKQLLTDDTITNHEDDDNNIITDRFNIYTKNKSIDDPFLKKINGEMRDVTSIREELRERRLMLANLTRSSSPINNIGCSSTSSSASSLSLKSQSSKIKGSGSYRDLYTDDTHNRKLKFFRNLTNDRQHQHQFNIPDTAYLIQKEDDDDDENSRSSNDYDDDGEIEHDVIIEEDEDQEEDDAAEIGHHIVVKNDDNVGVGEAANVSNHINNNNDASPHSPNELPIDARPTSESWGHSNSTTSLDSPSQSGGSTTHHRYYHVFREGELDALINHHVASLHIVSSYYERASWCVVAEKVQLWTI